VVLEVQVVGEWRNVIVVVFGYNANVACKHLVWFGFCPGGYHSGTITWSPLVYGAGNVGMPVHSHCTGIMTV
jgi:hypothetical protein